MIDGIIFDKDGTLFDFRLSWGRWTADLLQALAHDRVSSAKLGQVIGFDLQTGAFATDSPVIAATPTEIAQIMLPHLPRYGLIDLVEQMNSLSAATEMAPAVPLIPLLTNLRDRGLKIGLATNDTEVPARAHLADAGVLQMFDFIAGCDSGYGGKPAPGQLLAFSGRFGLVPARVAMVGDSQHDLVAGRAAGMKTVGVLTGIAEAGELAPYADVVLQDINGLPDWIDLISAL